MSHGFFATLFYIPVYNTLIFLIDILPGKNAGLAVILVTLIIRLALFPLSRKSIKTQLEMKQIEPEVQKIREKIKNRNEQGRQILALYKAKDVNPFAGLLLLIIQLPILIGLYQVFRSGLPKVNEALLYGFVHAPSSISMFFLGSDLMRHSIIFAALAVITQFIQINISLPKTKKKENASFQHDLAYSMNVQMRYIFPLILFPIAYISAVIALYLTTTNIFMIFQELFVRRKLTRQYDLENQTK